MKDAAPSNLSSKTKFPNNPAYLATIADLMDHPDVQAMTSYPHHGKVSCLAHCYAVSSVSYRLAACLGLDKTAVARAGLLHDFYLYDWHHKKNRKGLHGFTHARKSLANAQERFSLSPLEADIILKHMWPLGSRLPSYKESFLVCIVDKVIALLEITRLFRFHAPPQY